MQFRSHAVRRSLSIAGFLLIATCLVSVSSSDPAAPEVAAGIGLHMDPAKVVGEAKCAECHKAENDAWHQTHHFTTFAALPKNPRATQIATAMGLTGGIRRNSLCLNCHFTVAERDGAATPVSGVACESCHGPAKDWLALHNDYGTGATRATETAAHKAKRHADADAAGMIREDRIDLIADNCYSCHTVPDQELVNKGGHLAGSDIELVSWSQGEVRHNYLLDQTKNAPESPQRLRIFYVVGEVTDLEYALKGAKQITEKGAYRDAMLARVRNATTKVDEILKTVKIPEIDAVMSTLTRLDTGQLKLTQDVLNTVPDKLAAAASAFVKANDGSQLQAIDPLISKTVKGTPQP